MKHRMLLEACFEPKDDWLYVYLNMEGWPRRLEIARVAIGIVQTPALMKKLEDLVKATIEEFVADRGGEVVDVIPVNDN